MRTAAVLARLIPDTPEGRARIAFVSEGEASFHWCVDTGLVGNVMNVSSISFTCAVTPNSLFYRQDVILSSLTLAAGPSMYLRTA